MSNIFLSYFNLSIQEKLWIALVGILLPWLAAFLNFKFFSFSNTFDQEEFLPPFSLWVWILIILLGFVARFVNLTTLLVWPNFDESSYGFDAFHLTTSWSPRFFYGVSQAPPFFIWGLALFFKAFGTSLRTLWSFPAFVSLSAVPLSYWAARTFFSKSFSLLVALLTAVSFWPVFVGRFALMTILILPAEYLALLFLGGFLKAGDSMARLRAATFLGLVWGLGFYTHLHWPIVVALTFAPFIMQILTLEGNKNLNLLKPFWSAVGIVLLVVAPLVYFAFEQHFGHYLVHLWAFKKDFSFSKQISIWLSCLTSPFWGMDPKVHTYQPVWGGFLNPILSSLFFLGLIPIIHQWKKPFYLWILGGLLLCLLPGLLTQDQETFRLFPIVPLLILVILLGLGSCINSSFPRRNLFWVLALIIPSMGLDGYHLFFAYHHIWDNPSLWGSYSKSVARYRAFGILEKWKTNKGPGLIFPDFVQGLPDQSLAVATYNYNASLNPGLDFTKSTWAAVLTNVNYQPFLKKRFSDGISYGLSKDFQEPDGGWMLFIFPLDSKRLVELENWKRAQLAMEEFIDMNLCYVMGESFENDLAFLSKLEPRFKGDPFLQSSFFEKKADLEMKEALIRFSSGKLFLSSQDPALQSLERAVSEGYPAAHLYEHLGILSLMHQNRSEALNYFNMASQAPLNLTNATQYLNSLKWPASGELSP